MTNISNDEKMLKKKRILKDIIMQLHKGLSLEAAKDRFEKEIGEITAAEIAALEQALIEEGTSPDEIKKFCNVHALLFESSLKNIMQKEESPAHPVTLFKLENREIEKRLQTVEEMIQKPSTDFSALADKLTDLRNIEKHYVKKEQVLFPYLEKAGFMGPSKVMWGKDNEIRDLLRQSISAITEKKSKEETTKTIASFIEEAKGMIFKEENILFPTAIEKLTADDWVSILKESIDLGFIYISIPQDINRMIFDLKVSIEEVPKITEDGMISFPTGTVAVKDLMFLLNALPVDISFVDRNDKVAYFSDNKERIFVRTKSVLNREVRLCHPPNSVDKVEEILKNFKQGKKDSYDFWINFNDRVILIRYFAVRDKYRNYLGTLEITQDITDIKNLQGEKRLLDG
ncbi:MAG: hypothetical protein A2Y62_00785 [Candidatus Fischerbacteria bacterium RBG_13_37_8]|uniref:Histidine kinase n=1 Tax=Candidatus Fischerbacteria bacterium RBG_13_37_8 TaxID=1817863 RepID=A0A1F5VLW5_9BACT|nr:MAG: hypothetical protein A2Y62_00785 [Candidatus Fischerbacteria bacterium RBG_13_37_8]